MPVTLASTNAPFQQNRYRGSRKHILDWVSVPKFRSELEELIGLKECHIPDDAEYMPRGYEAPKEARLNAASSRVLADPKVYRQLRDWWLRKPKGANTPNWDLVVQCELSGRPGLILVEAKANASELSRSGKSDRSRSGRAAESEAASEENAAQIAQAIGQACTALASQLRDLAIGPDSHYQFSNRMAFAWKLATLGVPTVLLYVGFTGDKGLRGYLKTDENWRSRFAKHVLRVCPSGLTENPIQVGDHQFWVLNRSRPVLSNSPPAAPARVRKPGGIRRSQSNVGSRCE